MKRIGLLLAATCCLAASNAHAGGLFGLQAGGSFGPDQFVAGLHMGFALGPKVMLVPSADVGFGDEATTIAVNVRSSGLAGVSSNSWRRRISRKPASSSKRTASACE